MKTISVTIAIPVDDITVIDAHVMHDPETRETPEAWDVDYDEVHVEGLPKGWEVEEFDDQLDNLIIERWKEDT